MVVERVMLRIVVLRVVVRMVIIEMYYNDNRIIFIQLCRGGDCLLVKVALVIKHSTEYCHHYNRRNVTHVQCTLPRY